MTRQGNVNDRDRLAHILQTLEILLEGRKNVDLMRLKDNPIVFFGFVKNVEIIGEAAYKLSKDFKDSHKELPWKAIEGMRHVLVHGYYEISPEKLWDVIENWLPDMKSVMKGYIDEQNAREECCANGRKGGFRW